MKRSRFTNEQIASAWTFDSRIPINRDEQDHLRMRLKELAATRVRYGYRRIHIFLQREGWNINANRVYCL